ncbi:hypothetical protein [Hahella ganghwensis]|uniref:hypothetical protein n=1 Tax=Hahella ganghwensis TaxID=286420 RepID=UPI0003AAD2EF|nr:hypothetical protein [Hahella ganghwensis]
MVSGNPDLSTISGAALVTTGGGLPRLLENSPSIGTSLLEGLAASGLTQGSANLETFLSIAQGTVDSGDPLNFASLYSTTGTPVYLNEIYGDASDQSTRDQTIPIAADTLYGGDYTGPLNDALPAPLAGTEPLINGIGATSITTLGATATDAGVVRFTAGSHNTIIQPADATETAVFTQMMTNIASFFGSIVGGGPAAVSISDTTYVKTNEPADDI